ncbi:MAG TPA: cellulose biosynthesis cyclic di-GMP-binding regulatory protein BcsB [Pseudolabrys sp.]|nr:cellulose biosynthesis cyclic di-GMP-binding regulatory protein BcsB [Pseudolabrys sp.]
MYVLLRVCAALFAAALTMMFAPALKAQVHSKTQAQIPVQTPLFRPFPMTQQILQMPAPMAAPAGPLVATITLADIGFGNGIRFANLGGRREIFVPMPQGVDLSATELSLTFDDLTAHEARRSLEVLVNDRSAAAIALDGKGMNRTIRIPLGKTKARDGFLKLGFLYSGAATQDRCIDVRYVGDSLTVRPDTALEVEFDAGALHDVATIAALMPRDVSVVLPNRTMSALELSAAITVARSLAATGRRASFHSGWIAPPDLVDANGRRRWDRGTVVIGTAEETTGAIARDSGVAAIPSDGELNAIRVGGFPALLVSDGAAVHAARLLGNPSLAAARGLAHASVGEAAGPHLASDRVTFDQLGLALTPAEVYGRADLGIAIDTRNLPADTQLSRLALDIMVAPDGAGEKAVVSVFVNERLLASAVAAQGELTHIDLPLPDGLVGTLAGIRAVVQRRSPQGDCRFEPQGYPAQILGSSAAILTPATTPHDFSDLVTRWNKGIEILLPAAASEQPDHYLGLLADVVGALSPETAPVAVKIVTAGMAVTPGSAFIAVGAAPPSGSAPFVHFDRGHVAVNDRSGRTLLDLGGFTSGAVAQLVSAGGHPGIWVKPLSADGALPSPPSLHLGRGDVAFLDRNGIALAMSTERDTLIRVAYPEQTSWSMVAGRFRSWIVGSLWLFATIAFLFALQRMRRRRPRAADE